MNTATIPPGTTQAERAVKQQAENARRLRSMPYADVETEAAYYDSAAKALTRDLQFHPAEDVQAETIRLMINDCFLKRDAARAELQHKSKPAGHAGAVSPEFLHNLKDIVSLDDLIGGYVQLRSNGRGLVGLCPFHEDSTPSFHVYADGHFKCYGCDAYGDHFDFLQRKENLSFIEAAQRLAERAHLEWPIQKSGALAGAANPAKTAVPKVPKPTDDELRDRWLRGHELTAFGLGEFRRYVPGGYWEAIAKEQVQSEAAVVIEQSKAEGIRPTAGLLKSVVELARVKLFVADERWDADPDLLVMANGTLHLPTRTLREHAPADHITLALPYAFDPEATAPVWEYFLASTIPEAADFVQEFSGYALTTDTRHEIAAWLVGEAGSGKSTCITGLDTMLGPKVGRLGLADIEKSRFALAGLPGKTLAMATEQPSLFIQASHVLNALISGEPVTVERKYEDAYTFTPRVKIIWAMNELPRVADTTNGLFRRVKVIRFRPLPEAERDPKVKLAIANEGPGILNWALAGLARLQARGRFEVPSSVREATDHFQQTNDVPSLFVADACLTGADYRVQSADLYGAYRNWCETNGHRSQSATSMSAEWERLGFEKYKSGGKAYYRGIGLTSPLMS